jgi:hypothetical protein
MRAGVADTDASSEQIAVGAAALTEVSLFALGAGVDDEVAGELDWRRRRSGMAFSEGCLAAGRGAVPLARS